MLSFERIKEFVTEEFEREYRDEFRWLRSVPDTGVHHFIYYLVSLGPRNRKKLVNETILRAACLMAAGVGLTGIELPSLVAREKWLESPNPFISVGQLSGWKAIMTYERNRNLESTVPENVRQIATTATPAKPANVRKLLFPEIRSLLGEKPQNKGGGAWQVSGNIRNTRVRLDMDFTSPSYQFRYELTVAGSEVELPRVSREKVLGVGHGDWDSIFEHNLSASVAALIQSVEYCASLPERFMKFA